MITFEQIQKANVGLVGIDVKGKNYIMVPQRVRAFRQLYPEGFIHTKLVSLADGVCVMQSEAGYYENGVPIVLGTGMAFERQESSFINKTSYIENCETSAVGRALGFLGLGIDGGGICSAEELINAVNNQSKGGSIDTKQSENDVHEAGQGKTDKVADLAIIRNRLEAAIKAKTKDMSREDKIQFLNTVVVSALEGQRNWRLCEDVSLLNKLLARIEENAA